jgi:hypothetical protein
MYSNGLIAEEHAGSFPTHSGRLPPDRAVWPSVQERR